MDYALPWMRGLIACPFCREMFEPGEEKECPVCGVALQRVEKLPKTSVDAEAELEPLPPDEEKLPFTYAGRGRGLLVLTALAGLGAFMLPWIHQIQPEPATLTGPELASKLGWMWAPLVSWLVMIPLVLSRRSIYRMRGARVAVAFLAAMSLATVIVRVVVVPHSSRFTPVEIGWGSSIYLSAALSVVALGLAATFGGRIDVLATKKQHRRGDETLH
jgi:hypothetical protein